LGEKTDEGTEKKTKRIAAPVAVGGGSSLKKRIEKAREGSEKL